MPSAAPAPVPASYDRRQVGWLSLAQLITWGSVFYTFALIIEPIERDLGVGRAQSSLAFSLALLAEGLCAYPIGRWIDRGHERAVMAGGSLLVGLCLGAHSLVTSLAGFYAVWTLLGVAMAATLYTPVFAVVTRRFPDDYRRAKNVHLTNRLIPCLVPLGLAALLLAPWAAGRNNGLGLLCLVLFVVLYGLGNGMMTIVRGTAIAQYVNRDYVASLNGALGLPLALGRAAAPLALGLLWSQEAGYRYGLWLLLGLSSLAIVALLLAQRRSLIGRPVRL